MTKSKMICGNCKKELIHAIYIKGTDWFMVDNVKCSCCSIVKPIEIKEHNIEDNIVFVIGMVLPPLGIILTINWLFKKLNKLTKRGK